MNRYIFLFLIAAFSLLLHAKCVAQNNTVYGAGISYTNGIPTFVPPSRSARVAIDTVTGKWYEFATPGGWRFAGDRIQRVSGCSAPSYTPTKAQSWIVINGCTEAQNGQGPELYYYTGSNWIFINEKSTAPTYTAGTGINISGTVISNTAPDQVVSIAGAGINAITGIYPNFTVTGTEVDGSTTNELQTLSVAGNNLTISDGNTVTLPTPSSTLDALTDVTITSPINAQILQYNTATTQWVNATLAAITGSGTAGQVAYWNGPDTQTGASELIWDAATKTLKLERLASPTYPDFIKLGVNTGGVYGDILMSISGGQQTGIYMSCQSETMAIYAKTNGTYIGSTTAGSKTTLGCLRASAGGGTYINFSTNGTATGLHVTHNNGADLALMDSAGRLTLGGASINTSSKLEVTSTTGGLLFPRMTTTQRDAIASPPDGLVLYNTTAAKLQVRAAGAWVDLH